MVWHYEWLSCKNIMHLVRTETFTELEVLSVLLHAQYLMPGLYP